MLPEASSMSPSSSLCVLEVNENCLLCPGVVSDLGSSLVLNGRVKPPVPLVDGGVNVTSSSGVPEVGPLTLFGGIDAGTVVSSKPPLPATGPATLLIVNSPVP